ncbi:MAG: hypothetical protein CMJ15_03365 [Pelagibacterium sp.]|uniref:hypothetical protein n=1 Tax=uncultured Pelagibacterium sp. TaxID=1159875 RepID=UPI000C4A2B27|nr:hypothetical protein [Pelagibacterium sp.]
MFTKPLSGRSYSIKLAIRGGVTLALFIVTLVLFFPTGECSRPGCAGELIMFFYAAVAAFAIFLLSIVGISVRRARDAGWHPLIGFLPVLTPFTAFLVPLGVLPTGLNLLFLPMPLNIAWLITILAFCSARTTPRWQSANNRPPRI